jgi:hypothetical protein
MIRFAMAAAGLAVVVLVAAASAQSPEPRPVALETQSATRALDAVPAVFAVARNLEGIEINVSLDAMERGFSDLAGQPAAQEQLAAALGVYGYETYGEWAATIRTIFATYAFVKAEGAGAPTIEPALQQVLNDPRVTRAQKDAIVAWMDASGADAPGTEGVPPSEGNLVAVIALVPHIASTIEMMQAMQ